MSYPKLDQEDFAGAFSDLLPTGPVWPRHRDSTLMKLTDAVADSALASHLRAQNVLLDESYPARTVLMLPEWERSYGLPDSCSPDNMTFQERRNALLAKIGSIGGQSKGYYQSVAAALGYDVTIREFQPFVAGSRAGDYLNDEDWSLTWRVETTLATTIRYFRAGQSNAGEHLATWGDQSLECVFQAIKPAHTILQFGYGSS